MEVKKRVFCGLHNQNYLHGKCERNMPFVVPSHMLIARLLKDKHHFRKLTDKHAKRYILNMLKDLETQHQLNQGINIKECWEMHLFLAHS